MDERDGIRMKKFIPSDIDTCVPAWQDYKREFLVLLDAKGLDDKPGKRQVGTLLQNMGMECIKIYDTFEWAPAVQAIAADADNNIAAVPARPAEDKANLQHVFQKFDQYWGVNRYRAIKRQEFLDTKRQKNDKGELEPIMDFITKLRRKAEYCEFDNKKDSFICDKIINGIQDSRCAERLLDIPDAELNLTRVIQVCRQYELTQAHIKAIDTEQDTTKAKDVHYTARSRGRSRGRSRARGRAQGYQGNFPYCDRCCKHHAYRSCPAFDKNCDTCGQRGHFKKSPVCKNSSGTSTSRGRFNFNRQGQRSHDGRNFRGRYNSYSYRGYRPQGRGYQNNNNRRDVHYADDYDYDYLANQFDEHVDMNDVFIANVSDENDISFPGAKNYNANDWVVQFDIDNSTMNCEIDTGARCNIISLNTLKSLDSKYPTKRSKTVINGVHGKCMKSLGIVTLPCSYRNSCLNVDFEILDAVRGLNLLGRHDCTRFGLIARVNNADIMYDISCKQIISRYKDVVGDSIGCMPGEYAIKVDETIEPVVHPPRPVPAPIREQVKVELQNLERKGIIAQVTEPTEWVNSMVCVRKKNGRIRICIDPTDLNKAVRREHFPLNNFDDIVTRIGGSKVFSTLDANMGYFQMKLTEESANFTTFNTPFGRFKYLRMPMGIKCASDVFQREMIHQFGDIQGVEIVMDDILIHGRTPREHNERLVKVLNRARKINLKFNEKKCKFGQKEVVYVGHRLTGEGLKPTEDRVNSITKIREPQDFQELETILGMIAYVAKFIPNLSAITAPMRKLRTNGWTWGPEQADALKKVKNALMSAPVLRYYDVKKPVTVSVDASKNGLGAAIMQDDGVIAYASRAMTPTEEKYAQIEKEALAIVFGCSRFHKLIYGKQDVKIESDHKPLENIFRKSIHKAPMRIQRMMLKLQPYDLSVIHIKGKSIGLADCLSRMPHDEPDHQMDDELMVCRVDVAGYHWNDKLREATERDTDLQILKRIILRGWPELKTEIPAAAAPYWNVKEELSVYNGIIYRGERVCIPTSLRAEVMTLLHSSHAGIVRTKQLAREKIHWPGLNKQIEEVINRCETCLKHRNRQQREPMNIHPIPSRPWSKVATDLFEIDGTHYLVMVDYYSNYIELDNLEKDTRASNVIRHIKQNIARHGIMDTLVSDNGPQYACCEFADFTRKYGIKHITSSPQYPQSNGLAEKAVQTVKTLIKKCRETNEDIHLAMLDLRNTPRDEELGSPMQRLMGRRARTRLPMTESLLKPEIIQQDIVHDKLMNHRMIQKSYYDRTAKPLPNIEEGRAIRIQTPQGWQPAEFIGNHELPRSHIVKAGNQGRFRRRNRRDIITTGEEPHVIRPVQNQYIPTRIMSDTERVSASQLNTPVTPPRLVTPPRPAVPELRNQNPVQTTRSGRQIKPPGWMRDHVK